MGAAIGTDDKKSVNVELNIVPFIDLMSCLTAFLLATAVWVNTAQLNTQAKGRSRAQTDEIQEEKPKLSVLIQSDRIWVGASRSDEGFTEITNKGVDPDWKFYEETLKKHKDGTTFSERTDIEIAAESSEAGPVRYKTMVRAMDIAVAVGFIDVGIAEPAGLSARPTL